MKQFAAELNNNNEKWIQVVALTTEPIKFENKMYKVFREELDNSRKRFIGIPVYLDHQRTEEDYLGVVSDSFFTQDKLMLRLKLLSKSEIQKTVLSKIKDGEIKNVSLGFTSCDFFHPNETIMTDIQPKEISVLSGMTPICPSCDIFEKNFACKEEMLGSLLSETNAMYLVPPHGQMIARGDKTIIIKKKLFSNMVGKEMFLVSGSWCYGTIILKNPKTINLNEFEKLKNQHQITETERKSWWGRTKKFYAYPFVARLWANPKKVKMKHGVQNFGKVEFEEKLITSVESYVPEMLPIDVLRDDFRIVMAWYSSKKEGKELKFSLEEIEDICEKIIREFLRRNKKGRKGQITVFHPDKMKPQPKELFEKIMKKTGVDKKLGEFTNVYPSEDHDVGDNLTTSDFEEDWSKPIKLIEDFVTVVGGVTNWEDGTTGDIDVLLKMPSNSFLDVPTKFRLSRAIVNKDVQNRLHFLYDEHRGPFTSHIPKYDLVLVPKFEKVHEMGGKEIQTTIQTSSEISEDMVCENEKDEILTKPKVRTEDPVIINDARTSEKENKILPFRFFYQMKPMHGRHPEGLYTIDNLYDIFLQKHPDWRERGVFIEKKADAQTVQIHKLGDEVRIWIEDGGEVTKNLPSAIDFLKKMKDDFVLLAETELWEEGKKQSRAESNGVLHTKEVDPREKNICLMVYDVLWINGKDIHESDYSEREKIYSSLKGNDNLKINPHWFTKTKEEFKETVEKASKKDYSEGAILKTPDFKYNLSLASNKGFVKYKNEFSLIAKVIGKHKVAGSEKTHFYYCAIKDEKNKDVFIGRTFNTLIDAEIGEKIKVVFADISKYYDVKKNITWYAWWSPRVTEKSHEVISLTKEADSLVEKTTGRIEEKTLPKLEEVEVKPEGVLSDDIEEKIFADPYMEISDEDKTHKYVIQHHFRGKSSHSDIRFKVNNYCVGWTLDDSIEGKITEPVLTLDDAKKWDAKPIYKIDWEKGKMRKTLSKTGKKIEVKIVAQTKAVEPLEWLNFEGVQPIGKPGSTKEFPGVFHIIDKGRVEWGCMKSYFHEYFLSEGKLKGTILFRLLKNIWKMKPPKDGKIFGEEKYPEIFLINEKDGNISAWVPAEYLEKEFAEEAPKTGRGEFVWFMFMKSSDDPPYVLSRRAVKIGWMPPKDFSALPSSIRKLIPKEYHYWEKDDSGERKELRDKLVSLIRKGEIKILTENIEEKKPKLTHPFILQRYFRKGQQVIRGGVSLQHWNLRIDVGKPSSLDFVLDRNPVENESVSGILKSCNDKSSMDVGKKGVERFEPGTSWNPTKETPAFVEALDWDTVDVLENTDSFKKFNFHGKILKGLYVAIREGDSDIWSFSKSLSVGQKNFAKLKIHGCAIKSGVMNGVYYSPEIIKTAKRSLYNREITIDHGEDVSVRNIVGRTTDVFFRKNALYFKGIIYDDEIAKKIKNKLIKGCSVRMKVIKNPNEQVAKRIEFINVSLVIGPACKETKIEVE